MCEPNSPAERGDYLAVEVAGGADALNREVDVPTNGADSRFYPEYDLVGTADQLYGRREEVISAPVPIGEEIIYILQCVM